MPELSIIIVHHRTPELFKLCLKSLKENLRDIEHEILIIDSMSTRRSRDTIAQAHPEAQLLAYQENVGYSRGVNIGLSRAQGKYLLVLNPDIIVEPGAIQKMIAYMGAHPDIGVLGPRLLNFNGTWQRSYFRYYQPLTVVFRRTPLGRMAAAKRHIDHFLMVDTDHEKIQTPDWIMGSAMLVSRRAYEAVGPMDERFFMYFEDVDWCRRFWHNGYAVVYYPAAVLHHYWARESKSRLGILDAIFNKRTRWHIISALKFFWKYRDLRLALPVKFSSKLTPLQWKNAS
jgi:N-acetylglucosaminyl-diphospho-decaprenol L-rhamnosyltransferase